MLPLHRSADVEFGADGEVTTVFLRGLPHVALLGAVKRRPRDVEPAEPREILRVLAQIVPRDDGVELDGLTSINLLVPLVRRLTVLFGVVGFLGGVHDPRLFGARLGFRFGPRPVVRRAAALMMSPAVALIRDRHDLQ